MPQDEVPPEPIEALFRRAAVEYGLRYIEPERGLRARGAEALAYLRRARTEDPDPFARYLASTLADWIEGQYGELDEAMARLEQFRSHSERGPAGPPGAATVDRLLTQRYEARLVPVLALRLAKSTHWLPWLKLGVLFHLRQHPTQAVLPALIRFALYTVDPPALSLALETIEVIDGDAVVPLLFDEARHWYRLAQPQPPRKD